MTDATPKRMPSEVSAGAQPVVPHRLEGGADAEEDVRPRLRLELRQRFAIEPHAQSFRFGSRVRRREPSP